MAAASGFVMRSARDLPSFGFSEAMFAKLRLTSMRERRGRGRNACCAAMGVEERKDLGMRMSIIQNSNRNFSAVPASIA